MPVLFDVVIVLLLIFFAWRGAVKGLVLSLCGLAAVFVAFIAAQLISDAFCVPVANIIRPVITDSIEDAIQGLGNIPVGGEQNPFTMGEVLDYLTESELFQGFSDFIKQAVDANAQKQSFSVNALANYLSRGIAKIVLFAIVFLVVQLVWFLVSHMLDLAFHLPILAQANLAGGLVIGLIKGVLLIIVLVWLGQMSGIVPAEPDTPILALFTVEGLTGLLAKLPA